MKMAVYFWTAILLVLQVNGQSESQMETVSSTTQSPTSVADCSLPSDPGFCFAMMWRYFWNEKSGRCETFIWGGCGGNSNKFETLKKCREACDQSYNPESGTKETETSLAEERNAETGNEEEKRGMTNIQNKTSEPGMFETSTSQNVAPVTSSPQTSPSQTVTPGSSLSQTSSSQTVTPEASSYQTSSSQTVTSGSSFSQTSTSQTVTPGSSSSQTSTSQNVAPEASSSQTSTQTIGASSTNGISEAGMSKANNSQTTSPEDGMSQSVNSTDVSLKSSRNETSEAATSEATATHNRTSEVDSNAQNRTSGTGKQQTDCPKKENQKLAIAPETIISEIESEILEAVKDIEIENGNGENGNGHM